MTPVERQNKGMAVSAYREQVTRELCALHSDAPICRPTDGYAMYDIDREATKTAHRLVADALYDAKEESLALERSFGVDSLMRRDP
jgi:hypothetical protein